MQQSVLFSILMILTSKRKVSREYLAERFSVSVRTVSRYLGVLADAGVPIISETGPNGGISLADDFVLDKTFFSEAETLRIKDALKRTANDYGDKINLSIAEKLEVLEKSREHDNYTIKQDDLYIDCGYAQAELLRPKIKTLSRAIDLLREADITYIDARGSVSYRTIQPYTLVFKEGSWYVYAMCRLRGDFRLFKLSRINDLRLTSKSFVKTDSKLVEKLGLEFYNDVYADIEFELFPASPVTESVTDWLGVAAITERGTKLVARAEVPLNDSLYKKLLSYGSSIKVLGPPELKERLKKEASLMTSVYSE